MLAKMEFRNFFPNPDLLKAVSQILNQLIVMTPVDTVATAFLEKTKNMYRCSIDIYSKNEIFIISKLGKNPNMALEKMEKILWEKIINFNQQKKFSGEV